MNPLDVLRQASKERLTANPVAVPELAHLFDKNEPTLFYIATLSALDKDQMDTAFVAYKKEFGQDDSMEVYRCFVVAYCLCDKDNARVATTNDVIFSTTQMLKGLGNVIVSRMFNVANGANGIFGLPEVVAKKSVEPVRRTRKGAGNGASQSVSDTPADPPGSETSAAVSTAS